jgi:hypothetical protein
MNIIDKEYEVVLTTIQAVVLLVLITEYCNSCYCTKKNYMKVFDKSNSKISFASIQEQTGIDDIEALKRVLHSLSSQKFKILSKHSSGILFTYFICNNKIIFE